MIRAIETRYRGYRFRSRLEARCAVFFGALGVRYRYECEGFQLPGNVFYLPDFWLPDQECWVEVKPEEHQRAHVGEEKAILLANESGYPVVMFDFGELGAWSGGFRFSPGNAERDEYVAVTWRCPRCKEIHLETIPYLGGNDCRCGEKKTAAQVLEIEEQGIDYESLEGIEAAWRIALGYRFEHGESDSG